MGEIIQFRPLMKYGKRTDAQARLEQELQIPLKAMPKSDINRPLANAPKITPPNAPATTNLPLNGIAIVLGSILVYALMISHVVGQPHYSARANLLPPVFEQN
ncbi:hypothetical protein [Rhizobium rhizogenes]|uniref:hypothetical protein n=1 Tax=Rhizobium rhizogenes TaxID=359 RepID=UPI001573C8A1|nr:hypothetical protein [Rhizobium rhizogenes]NTF45671.1 hypothetical protein [Rhizobium rhizogenes]